MIKIDLSGKVAFVIGGSRGIGAAITKTLCLAGAYTVFSHTGNPKYKERVNSLVENIQKEGGKVKTVILDALDARKTENLVDDIVYEHNRVDILVCNVGKNLPRPIEETSQEDWKKFIDLNLTTAFNGIYAVIPHMVEKRYGRIILIGSSTVYDGGGGAIDYAAAKAGMIGIMKYLCRNYTRKGILTNIVHPAVIDTDLLRERYSTDELRKNLTAQIPVGRLGKPEDIAGMVAYLASSYGDYICGQEILLDGGRTIFK